MTRALNCVSNPRKTISTGNLILHPRRVPPQMIRNNQKDNVSTLGVQLWISAMGRSPCSYDTILEHFSSVYQCGNKGLKPEEVVFHPLEDSVGVLTLPLSFDRPLP